MTAKQIERLIKADGWYEIRSGGSSQKQYKHPTKKGKVTISFHAGDIPPGTISSILRQAGLK
jgi:predicted RNA binding protein YcfA (HicA-like mRNA interferase family)